jgi:hypothetical protein
MISSPRAFAAVAFGTLVILRWAISDPVAFPVERWSYTGSCATDWRPETGDVVKVLTDARLSIFICLVWRFVFAEKKPKKEKSWQAHVAGQYGRA